MLSRYQPSRNKEVFPERIINLGQKKVQCVDLESQAVHLSWLPQGGGRRHQGPGIKLLMMVAA